jgi:hypothetical protein
LRRTGEITEWHDRRIDAAASEGQIDSHLKALGLFCCLLAQFSRFGLLLECRNEACSRAPRLRRPSIPVMPIPWTSKARLCTTGAAKGCSPRIQMGRPRRSFHRYCKGDSRRDSGSGKPDRPAGAAVESGSLDLARLVLRRQPIPGCGPKRRKVPDRHENRSDFRANQIVISRY